MEGRSGWGERLTRDPSIAMAIASSLDLNSLDNLSRTCRQVRQALLQYRGALVTHTLHCENEDIPVDPEDTFRYRARAGNWFYMVEDGRGDYGNGKSGSCARDLVAECRRCARVVCRVRLSLLTSLPPFPPDIPHAYTRTYIRTGRICRLTRTQNCAIKPPAPVVLRDRHRRLCLACAKAPLGALASPRLRSDTPLDADEMQLAICTCVSDGVWLCQPCGRSIRGADHDYQSYEHHTLISHTYNSMHTQRPSAYFPHPSVSHRNPRATFYLKLSLTWSTFPEHRKS